MSKKTEIRDSLARVHDHIGILVQARYTLAVANDLGLSQIKGSDIDKLKFASGRIAKEIQVLEELTGGKEG